MTVNPVGLDELTVIDEQIEATGPRAPDGSGQAVVEFLDVGAAKGMFNRNTAGAMKAAVTQVLAVEGKDLAEIDVRTLNTEDILKRFANLRKQDFTPKSLETYQSRFRTAVSQYLSWLENPVGYRPFGKNPGASAAGKGRSNGGPAAKKSEPPLPPAPQNMVDYPFPIREGVLAHLRLPVNLRRAEAKRLAGFLESLAVEEQPALPAGRPRENRESE